MKKHGTLAFGVLVPETIKKRMRARLLTIKISLRRTMHDPIAKTGAWMKRMLQGHSELLCSFG
jgi:RNA-directed DNA polymerase